METLYRDLSLATRALRRSPGFAVAVLLTLTIGIGANATAFSVTNWLLLRPLPGVAAPDDLVAMTLMPDDLNGAGPVSHQELLALNSDVTALTGVAGYFDVQLNVAPVGGTPRRLDASIVTRNFFDVLGGPLALGRGFNVEEGDNVGAPPVAVISHRFWTSAMAGAVGVVGRLITVNGNDFTVIGVTPHGFHGPSRAGATDIWVPAAQHLKALPMYGPDLLTDPRRTLYFGIVGRLAPRATLAQAEGQANAVRDARAAAGLGGRQARWRLHVRSGLEPMPWLTERLRTTMSILLAGVGLLLLLTCANVGNLMLARSAARQSELATRLALGATRFRIARLLLVESGLLSTVAGALGIGMALVLTRALDGTVILPWIAPLGRVELDWRVLGFSLAVSTVVAVGAGLAPASGVMRISPAGLREAGRGVTRSRGRQVLTAVQVAVSVCLLLGAALLVRSMQARLAIDAGFDPSRVLTFSVEPGLQNYTPQRTEAFYRDLLDRTRQVPGVRAAGLAWLQPFSQGAADTRLRAEGAAPERAVSANSNMVSPGFLGAMGIRLLDGRDFSDAEFMRNDAGGGGVVILTATIAREMFGTTHAAGRRVVMTHPEGRVRTVVGVIPDQRQRRVTDPSGDLVLEPFGQTFPAGFAAVQVGLDGRADRILDVTAGVVRGLDPALPVYRAETLDDALRRSMSNELMLMWSVTIFAGLAVIIASIGLAAVMARAVVERHREFWIRMACGATPGRVIAQVMREGVRVAATGVAGGLVLSWWLSAIVESQLFGVTVHDPVSVVGTIAGVLALSMVASAWPARKVRKWGGEPGSG